MYVNAFKRPLAPAATPLLGDAVGSRDEERVINKEMLFKGLTSHSLMRFLSVPQAALLDNLGLLYTRFKIEFGLFSEGCWNMAHGAVVSIPPQLQPI